MYVFIFHIFSLFSLYVPSFQQSCYDLDQAETTASCFSCTYNYYKNVTFDWNLTSFDETLCSEMSLSTEQQEIYINSSINDCSSIVCDGSLSSPFNDLFLTFENIMINNLQYFNSTVIIYLFGEKSHYLYSNKTIDNPFYVFRRNYINITIQPLLCQDKPLIAGCFLDEESTVEILLKRSDILLFISNYMMIKNLIFNGIDLVLYTNCNDEQIKANNLRTTICTEVDLNSLTFDPLKSLCFLENQPITFSNQALYGLFNLEPLYDCPDCSNPYLHFENCQFTHINAINQVSSDLIALINLIGGFWGPYPSDVSLNNVIINKCFLYKGIYNIQLSNDNEFYKYVNPYSSPSPTTPNWNFSVTNSSFMNHNYYGNVLLPNENLDFLAFFNLKNSGYSTLQNLNFVFTNNFIYNISNNATFLNVTFYFIYLAVFYSDNYYMLMFQNNYISLFSYGFLLYTDMIFQNVLFDSCTLMNNSEITILFCETFITFSNNIIDNVFIGNQSFIQIFETTYLSIIDCVFTHLTSLNDELGVLIESLYWFSYEQAFTDNYYIQGELFLYNVSVIYVDKVAIIQSDFDGIMCQANIINCNFDTFNLADFSVFSFDVNYNFLILDTVFSNIQGFILFNFTYSRTRIFNNITLQNSRILFLRSYHNPNHSLNSDILVLNSKFSNIIIDFEGDFIDCYYYTLTSDQLSFAMIGTLFDGIFPIGISSFLVKFHQSYYFLFANITCTNVNSYQLAYNEFLGCGNFSQVISENSEIYLGNIQLFYIGDCFFMNPSIEINITSQGAMIIENSNFQKGETGLQISYDSIQSLLIFNCTFSENVNDIGFYEATASYIFDNDIQNTIFTDYNIFCYFLLQADNYPQLILESFEDVCPNPSDMTNTTTLYFNSYLIADLSTFNDSNNGKYGIWNCTFLQTKGIMFASFLDVGGLLILKNCLIKDIWSDGDLYRKDFPQVFISQTNFTNITRNQAKTLLFLKTANVFIVDSYFYSISSQSREPGLIEVFANTNLTLINCYIANINVRNGGFIYCERANVVLINIIMNNLNGEESGTALQIEESYLVIELCIFTGIVASSKGVIFLNYMMSVIVLDTIIENCKNGIYIEGSFPRKESSTFIGFHNFSCISNSGEKGTCIFVNEAGITILNSLFTNNVAQNSLIEFATTQEYTYIFSDCIFTNNNNIQVMIQVDGGTLILESLSFENNPFGIYLLSQNSNSLNIYDCNFSMDDDQNSSLSSNIFMNQYFISSILSNLSMQGGTFYAGFYARCLISLSSQMIIEDSYFSQCLGAIKAQSSSLTLNEIFFIDNYESQGNEGAVSLEDSNLTCFGVNFSMNKASSGFGSDIFADSENSLNQINIIEITSTNFTLISMNSIRVAENYEVNMSNVQFSSIYPQSQALLVFEIKSINLNECFFYNLSSLSAFKASNSKTQNMIININSSWFFNCSSDSQGGAFYLDGMISLNLTNTVFNQNFAMMEGGAIFIRCIICTYSQFLTNINMTNNLFQKNAAGQTGGALKISHFNPEILMKQNDFQENLAPIGSNLSGDPRTIQIFKNVSIINESTILENIQNSNYIEAVSGNTLSFVALLSDDMQNNLTTYTEGSLSVSSNSSSLTLMYNTENIINGTSQFDINVYGTPNSSYTLSIIFSDDINVNYNFTLYLRLCEPGEYLFKDQCLQCAVNFYSLYINQSCVFCPVNAYCPGGNLIIPQPNYWRYHENSSLIIKCSNLNSCPDQSSFFLLQNSTEYNLSKKFEFFCGEGSYGLLCVKCKKNYALTSEKACEVCKIRYDVIILAIINFLILAYQTTKAFDVQAKDSISRSLMKILINHNNYLLSLQSFGNILSSNNLDMIISLNSQISTVGTITDATIFDCFLQKFVNADDIPITRSIFFSFFPLVIVFCLFFLRVLIIIMASGISKLKKFVKEKNIFSILISCFILVVYSFYPKLVLNTFSLLKCISLDNSSTKTFLEMDPNIQCWEEYHIYCLKSVFIPNLILWCLGWPLIYGISLFYRNKKLGQLLKKKKKFSRMERLSTLEKSKKANSTVVTTISNVKSENFHLKILISDEEKDQIFQENKIYRFLTIEYHPNSFYWDLFFFGTNLIITPLSLQSSSMEPVVFSAILMVIFFFMLILSMVRLPFRYSEVNDVCLLSYAALLTTYYSVSNIVVEGVSNAQQVFYTCLIFLINGSFYILWIWIFVVSTFLKFKEKVKGIKKSKKSEKSLKIEEGIMTTKIEFKKSEENLTEKPDNQIVFDKEEKKITLNEWESKESDRVSEEKNSFRKIEYGQTIHRKEELETIKKKE